MQVSFISFLQESKKTFFVLSRTFFKPWLLSTYNVSIGNGGSSILQHWVNSQTHAKLNVYSLKKINNELNMSAPTWIWLESERLNTMLLDALSSLKLVQIPVLGKFECLLFLEDSNSILKESLTSCPSMNASFSNWWIAISPFRLSWMYSSSLFELHEECLDRQPEFVFFLLLVNLSSCTPAL